MKSITAIDSSLTRIVEDVIEFASKIQFIPICDFEVSSDANESIPWDHIKFPGIYFIGSPTEIALHVFCKTETHERKNAGTI